MAHNETVAAPIEGHTQLNSDSKHTEENDTDPEAVASISPPIHVITPHRSGPGDVVRDNMLLYLTLNAGNTLVNQVTRTVFSRPGDEALFANVESFLQDITWVLAFTRHNFLTTPVEHTVRLLTRRTVTNGSETNRELNIGAAYNGLSIGFGASHRTFSSTETVSEREVTTVYTIPPQSSLYVYQRRYRFRDEVWWIADAWNDLWNVCAPPGGYTLLRVPFESLIHADEQIAVDQPLTGSQRVSVQTISPPRVPWRQINRQFHNHTSRTRSAVQRVMNDANRQ